MAITIQTSYFADYSVGWPGMLGDGEETKRSSRVIEDAAGIAFGRAAFSGSTSSGITATPTAGKFVGIAIADAGVRIGLGSLADVFPQGETVELCTDGLIRVTASVAVTADNPAYVTPAGAFTNVASGNIAIPATFSETIAAGATAMLRVTDSAAAAAPTATSATLSHNSANADALPGMSIGALLGGERDATYSLLDSGGGAVALSAGGSELVVGATPPTTPTAKQVTVRKTRGGSTRDFTFTINAGVASTTKDTFSGAAGEANGRTAPTGGFNWAALGVSGAAANGLWSLDGNGRVQCTTQTTGYRYIGSDGLADCITQVTLQSYSSGTSPAQLGRLIFKHVDTSNYWFVQVDSRSNNVTVNFKLSNTEYERLSYTLPLTSSQDVTITVRTVGRFYTFWVNGTEIGTLYDDTTINAGTSFGFGIGVSGAPGTNYAKFGTITRQPVAGVKVNWPVWTVTDAVNPALPKGTGSAYDATDVNNPNVVYDPVNSRWVMYYSGYYNGGTAPGSKVQHMCVAYASSPDGPWTKEAANPVFSSIAEDGIYAMNGGLQYDTALGLWIHVYVSDNGTTIRLATAPSLTGTWTRRGVILSGDQPWKSLGAFDPSLRKVVGGGYELWYSGQSQAAGSGVAQIRAIGRATSPDGLAWTDDASNPQLAPLTTGTGRIWEVDVGEPQVITPSGTPDGSQLLMHFDAVVAMSGAQTRGDRRWIQQAVSLDWGKTWRLRPRAYENQGSGYENTQTFDAFVFDNGDKLRLYNAGANTLGAALNLNIQIGEATSTSLAALLAA